MKRVLKTLSTNGRANFSSSRMPMPMEGNGKHNRYTATKVEVEPAGSRGLKFELHLRLASSPVPPAATNSTHPSDLKGLWWASLPKNICPFSPYLPSLRYASSGVRFGSLRCAFRLSDGGSPPSKVPKLANVAQAHVNADIN